MDSAVMKQTGTEAFAQKRGISGSTLKIIAIIAMLIDHIGAVILERILINAGLFTVMQSGDTNAIMQFYTENAGLLTLYTVMRQFIGRLGFPIFCFLLVEGFLHTRNVTKYAVRLGIFALISEVPFDFAFAGKPFYFGYQNVFFTLFIGLLVMLAYQAIAEKMKAHVAVKVLLYIASFGAGALFAAFLRTDYGAIGIMCIMALYIFRKNKVFQIIAGCAAFLWEITAPLAFIPIGFYNGKRGLKMKYVFYAFYPLHLFVLYLIAYFCGLA